MTLAEEFLKRFRGRDDVIAVATQSGFAPHWFETGESLRPEWFADAHLSGRRCLGFYLMTPEEKVFCSCVDFDNKPSQPDPLWQSKAEQVYYFLTSVGLDSLVEISQSGTAAHVWLFFEGALDAWLVRGFWKAVAKHLETSFTEIYPRQDHLKEDGVGSLVRFPLWNQSRFVDVERDWAEMDPAEAIAACRVCTHFEIADIGGRLLGGRIEPEPRTDGLPSRVQQLVTRKHTLIGRRWSGDTSGLKDPSRSAVAQSIACELVRLYVPTSEVEMALRQWCLEHDYDKGQRDDWVQATVVKAYEFVVSRTEAKSRDTTTMLDSCHHYLDVVANGVSPHVASGIAALDTSIDGVSHGEVCVIAARPGHGKTALALQWLDEAASRGVPCLMVSEEMSALQLGKRSLLRITDYDERDWRAQVSEIREEVDQHYNEHAPIYVVENCNSVERLEAVLDQFVSIHGVRLAAVDYLQLIGGRDVNRYEVVTEVSRRLKQAASRNDVALLVLSQVNREIDKRDQRRPKLSDLRESGQIEQDADLVMFLQWPNRFDSSVPKDLYRIFVAKRRNGPIRTAEIETSFDDSRQTVGQRRYSEFDEYNEQGAFK